MFAIILSPSLIISRFLAAVDPTEPSGLVAFLQASLDAHKYGAAVLASAVLAVWVLRTQLVKAVPAVGEFLAKPAAAWAIAAGLAVAGTVMGAIQDGASISVALILTTLLGVLGMKLALKP